MPNEKAVGAEAEVSFGTYLGMKSAIKSRLAKSYRNKNLDEKVRKERTKQEALLLHRAKKAGVLTPFIYKIDKKGCVIIMEKIEGRLLKENLDENNYKSTCKEIGKMIARLHNEGIIHGDLTTSNIIMRDGKLVFIDFGLGFFSRRQEDFAVDLLNFKKTYSATHFRHMEGWQLLADSYAEEFEKGRDIIRLVEEIEKRARYF